MPVCVLQGHMRNLWKNDADPARCDWEMRQRSNLSSMYPTPTASVVGSGEESEPEPEPVVVTARRVKLNELARRAPSTETYRQLYTVTTYEIPLDTSPKDMRVVQTRWDNHLRSIYTSFCQQFWEIFLPVHTFPVHVIDTVLDTARKTFLVKHSPQWKKFPSSRRVLLEKTRSCGEFWPCVLHTCRIDVTGVLNKPLVSGTTSLTFRFLDPIWAWLTVAKKLEPESLHWRPFSQSHLDPVYGGGVQFGQCFREAYKSCPPGGYPMCISVHWDGTSGGGISSDPICIGVMNTNDCGAETQCCIGYMPKVPDQARAEFAKTKDSTTMKFHIRQECCRAILRVLESVSTRGVICTLPNRINKPVDRLLFPRLIAMNFDQPEAQLFFGDDAPLPVPSCSHIMCLQVTSHFSFRVTPIFTLMLPYTVSFKVTSFGYYYYLKVTSHFSFRVSLIDLLAADSLHVAGLKNKCCCTKCKRRKGFSAFRKSTAQSGTAVRRLYTIIGEGTPAAVKKVAREKLQRWGFNPTRPCCLHSTWDVDKLLVRLPGTDEVFPCLDYRDRMHGIFIFLHRVIIETLPCIGLENAQRRVLDERLAAVCSRRAFRDRTGKAYRRQRSVFESTGMTAADKVCWMFLIPHVFGHQPDLIPADVHGPLMTVIAHTQLIFIAVSGRRSYNLIELETIFDRGYVMIFGALEQIRAYRWQVKYQKHLDDPACPPPKRIKLPSKVWKDFSTPNTDTDDTDEEYRIGGLGYYSHGVYCLQHQHWVDQVISAGGFNVHCTQSAEAKHKLCMHLASVRVKHKDVNSTQSSMLQYLLLRSLFEDMKQFSVITPVRTRNYSSGLASILFQLKGFHRFTSVTFQETILHREVRLAGVELLELLCNKFGLPNTRGSYSRLEILSYDCGQKLMRKDGYTMWATDSQYFCDGRNDRRRRDILFIEGIETVDTTTRSALCCEAVLFLKVSNFSQADFPVPRSVLQDMDDDGTLTLILGRWFTPHHTVFERDSCYRPICPGPLHINHCLWKYATADTDRKVLVTSGGQPTQLFANQYQFFGQTLTEAKKKLEHEKRAYFTLLSPTNVKRTVNMCPVFFPNTSTPDHSTWLQTVTVL